jgi:hypothetical protein
MAGLNKLCVGPFEFLVKLKSFKVAALSVDTVGKRDCEVSGARLVCPPVRWPCQPREANRSLRGFAETQDKFVF